MTQRTVKYTATKKIDIDAAHRVVFHESKCRNLHGHRYTIELSVAAYELVGEGSQTGMVMDFSYIKQLMMQFIDAHCDHGTIVWIEDTELLAALVDPFAYSDIIINSEGVYRQLKEIGEAVEAAGCWTGQGRFGKLHVIPCIPTAENLAEYWYKLLEPRVFARSEGKAVIQRVRVWETASSFCDYPSIG